MELENNVGGLRCDTCWCTVDALWTGTYGGWLCRSCWSIQNGNTPESRMKEPAIRSSEVLSWIRPRNLGRLDRCPECKTEPRGFEHSDYRPGAMFHPAHQYGPCRIPVDGGVCGCRYGLPVLRHQD